MKRKNWVARFFLPYCCIIWKCYEWTRLNWHFNVCLRMFGCAFVCAIVLFFITSIASHPPFSIGCAFLLLAKSTEKKKKHGHSDRDRSRSRCGKARLDKLIDGRMTIGAFWNFPNQQWNSIRKHHLNGDDDLHSLVDIIFLAPCILLLSTLLPNDTNNNISNINDAIGYFQQQSQLWYAM